MKKLILAIVLLITIPCNALAWHEVRIRPPQSKEDLSHSYFVELLKLALEKTKNEYGNATVKITDFNAPQGRALQELQRNNFIDVDWAATNAQREKALKPIRIPLLGGLLGCRVPVIRTSTVENFSKIRTLDDLKKFTAIQGTHWPDTTILRHAGIRVQSTPHFGQMYQMLSDGRGDYFPRGINEAYAEFSNVKDKNLTLYDSLIIQYPMPMYFFTSKRQRWLADRIEKGLRTAINDGSFFKLIQSHPATAAMFPLSQYGNSTIIKLENPDLPPKTPINDKSLWLEIRE